MKKTPTAPRKRSAASGRPPTGFSRPRYPLDDGPLTNEQMNAIDRLQPPGRGKLTKHLF